jgi:hypothetical protein
LATREAQSFERLWARHFMDKMPIDIKQRRAVAFDVYDVIVPKLVVESLRSQDNRWQRAGAKASVQELCHRVARTRVAAH